MSSSEYLSADCCIFTTTTHSPTFTMGHFFSIFMLCKFIFNIECGLSTKVVSLNPHVNMFVCSTYFCRSRGITTIQGHSFICYMLFPSLICHFTMCWNLINFLYNQGHVIIWCLEVVPVVYIRVVIHRKIIYLVNLSQPTLLIENKRG